MSEQEHSRLSPSSTGRWIICPGSAAQVAPEQPPNDASIKGRKDHARAADILNGARLTKADTDDVRRYVKHVRHDGKNASTSVEETVQSLTVPDLFGTPDALIVSPDFIEVVDLKTGKWPVSAVSNPQLKTYLMLAVENYGPRDQYFGAIVQYGRVKFAEFGKLELTHHAHNVEYAADHPEEFRSGEHCLFCPWLRLKQCKIGMEYAQIHKWPERYGHLQVQQTVEESKPDADDA